MKDRDAFYVVARESGSEKNDLPVWASKLPNPFALNSDKNNVTTRVEVSSVPGAFQLLNVFTREEFETMVSITEQLGYTEDAAVSLPRHIRHNSNLTWVADDFTTDLIWDRCKDLFIDKYGHFQGKKPLGLNARFRFYHYGAGDFFKMHIDGSWPGSRIVDDQLVNDAYGDRWSMYTFLILLSDDFEGGETQFVVNREDPSKPARDGLNAEKVTVRTPAGSVLCFPHGTHPYHCLHGSAPVISGTKYIIRTDVLFEL
ncbi:2OG-Fe(II) oxygenase [Vibrio alginolyticus]|nr:2OG-Fe(II) oxygenase [Vibrio alginolyticus]